MYIYFSEQSTLALIFLRIEKDVSFRMYRPTKMTTLCRLPYNYLKYFFLKNYGSRSKKGEFLRFELGHNALNRKPQK